MKLGVMKLKPENQSEDWGIDGEMLFIGTAAATFGLGSPYTLVSFFSS